MRSCLVAATAAIGLVSVPPVFSQMVISTATMRADAEAITLTIDVTHEIRSPIVTGAPFSGRQTSKSVQTLADGTNLTRQGSTSTTYRDSMGRVRTERPAFPTRGGDAKPVADFTIVEILDVVAGHRYFLDSVNNVAHRAAVGPLREPIRLPGGSAPTASRVVSSEKKMSDGTIVKTESLGTQVISGVTAIGQRTTTIHPAGSRLGNDRPVSTVNENWSALQLGVTLLSKSTNLGSENTTVWEDVSTSEPDPALFQVPAGYQIVDETGPFKVVIPRQK